MNAKLESPSVALRVDQLRYELHQLATVSGLISRIDHVSDEQMRDVLELVESRLKAASAYLSDTVCPTLWQVEHSVSAGPGKGPA